MINEPILQEAITISSRYVSNIQIQKAKRVELQGKRDEPAVTVGDVNTPLSENGQIRQAEN